MWFEEIGQVELRLSESVKINSTLNKASHHKLVIMTPSCFRDDVGSFGSNMRLFRTGRSQPGSAT